MTARHGIILWPHAEGADYDALFAASAAVGGSFAGFMPLAFEDQAAWVTAAQRRWMMLAAAAGKGTYIGLRIHDASTVVAPAGVNADPGDPDWRTAYAQACSSLALLHQPTHFNIAVEANAIYVAHPEQWADFLAAFAQAKAAVKAASPGTIVYASLSYELMIGEFGGDPHLDLLDGNDTPAWERVGISTYPLWASTPYDPDLIPADYFDALRGLSLPVVIAETAWHTLEASGGTEAEQAQYVEMLPGLLEEVDPEVVLWVNARDAVETPNPTEPRFDRLGLIDWEDNAKPAMDTWTSLHGDEIGGSGMMQFSGTDKPAQCGASAGGSGAAIASGAAHAQAVRGGAPGETEHAVTTVGGFAIEAGIMLQAAPRTGVWPAGTYTVRFTLATAPAGFAAVVHVFVYRFNPSCGVVSQVGLAVVNQQLSTTGVYAFDVTGAESQGHPDDTIYVMLTLASESADSVGVVFDQDLSTPIPEPPFPALARRRRRLRRTRRRKETTL